MSFRSGLPKLTIVRGVLRLDSGHVLACPTGGPRCTIKASLKIVRTSRATGRPTTVYLTIKPIRTSVAPGARLRLAFRLAGSARRLLTRQG